MDRYSMPSPQAQSSRPSERPTSPRMDGNTRLLIVGGTVAIVAWFAWPYLHSEMGEIGRQISNMGNHSGFDPPFDPFGLRPKAEASDREPGRFPPGFGNAAGEDPRQFVTRRHERWHPGPAALAPVRGQSGRPPQAVHGVADRARPS